MSIHYLNKCCKKQNNKMTGSSLLSGFFLVSFISVWFFLPTNENGKVKRVSFSEFTF